MYNPSVLFHSEGGISSNFSFLLWPRFTLYNWPSCSVTLQLLQEYVGNSDCLYLVWLGFLVVRCWVLPYRSTWEHNCKSIPRHCTAAQRCWNSPCLKWGVPSLKEKS